MNCQPGIIMEEVKCIKDSDLKVVLQDRLSLKLCPQQKWYMAKLWLRLNLLASLHLNLLEQLVQLQKMLLKLLYRKRFCRKVSSMIPKLDPG